MKNENLRNERLSEWLTKVDDDLLDEAYSVDTADKLKKRVESEKIRSKTSLVQRPAFRGAIAVAACLALTVGAVLTVPALFRSDDIIVEPRTSGSFDRTKPNGTVPPSPPQSGVTPPHSGNVPNVDLPTGDLHINSIDMLNYYSAVRVLTDSSNSSASRLSAGGRNLYGKNSYGISLLSAGGVTELPYETPGAPIEQNPPTLPPVRDPDIYYYEFEPDQVFYIKNVLLFQIELTDENGFLASKLGTGVADVVISDDVIWGDSIITFKNGDRYYSCLTNGYSWDYSTKTWRFSTHKYIEGFCVVKNFEQENYQFTVSASGDQVNYFECSIWDKGTNPDGVLPVVSQTRISNVDAGFTIAELENYFNTVNLPEQGGDTTPDNASDVYMTLISDDFNLLILRNNDTVEYGHISTYRYSWHPRMGEYEKTEENLILRFYENGELVEETVVLVLNFGYFYNEERFLPYDVPQLDSDDPNGYYWGCNFTNFYSEKRSRFTLRVDGSFEYESASDALELRKGVYEWVGNDIILLYYDEGELVEETVYVSYDATKMRLCYNGEVFYH